ncbi:MAG: DUF2797 domain-containing protein, partial [Bacteroidetes bacterium]|nr:DUF2797 domain-containing protein [Bacteroidota bacterium]
DHLDIIEEKQKMQAFIPDELSQYYSSNDEIVEISYPALQFPTKVKSLSFDKLPEVGGKLEGIKGQYLIFDEGRVINLRKFTGYFVELVV